MLCYTAIPFCACKQRYKEAEEKTQALLKRFPDDLDILRSLGQVRYAQKNYSGAAKSFE